MSTPPEVEDGSFNVDNVSRQNDENIYYEPFHDMTEFPGYSEYIEKRQCCFRYAYFPAINATFIGHWKVDPYFPIVVYSLSISAFIIISIIGFSLYSYFEISLIMIILFIFMFLFLYSFTLTIIEGPGYFPFSFYHDNGLTPTKWSGIQTTSEQYTWVQLQEKRPPRSIFFRTAHRYVIRPDHYCIWAGSWIGKRNCKFFIIFNFYGMLYLSIFTVYIIRSLIILLFRGEFSVLFALAVIYSFLGIWFTIMTGHIFFESFVHSLKNVTNWEGWNHIDPTTFQKENCIENLKDVFGETSACLWFCPVSPWKNQTDYDISINYPSYDD